MVDSIVENIKNYIEYLTSLGYTVSYHDPKHYFLRYAHLLAPFNTHKNAYCDCVKQSQDAQKCCRLKQGGQVFEHAKNGAYYGMCWAGAEEFVFPIKDDNLCLAFISVSAFATDRNRAMPRLERVSLEFNIDRDALIAAYSKLKTAIPNTKFLATLVEPLCNMFTLLYLKTQSMPDSGFQTVSVYDEMLKFISENYDQNISINDVAKHCNYSADYIRHLFKKHTGKTYVNYLTDLRISQARLLLTSTDNNILQIAALVGFDNPDYFTNVFKKKTGLSPREYRRKTK